MRPPHDDAQARDVNIAGFGHIGSRNRAHDFRTSRSRQTGESDDFARAHAEVDIANAPRGQSAHGEHERRIRRNRR